MFVWGVLQGVVLTGISTVLTTSSRWGERHGNSPEQFIDLSGRCLGCHSTYSQAELDAVARRLNERPRKTLNFDTPAERFHQSVASTA